MGVPVQVRPRLPFYLKMMFSFVTIGTNNLIKSKFFYDELLQSINIINVLETERYIGYAKKDTLKKVEFYIMMPHNKKNASFGNGSMITFNINTKKEVKNFYNLALKLKATDEGFPGPRHGENYYAYFRDLDGNKICAFSSD
jgi:predicted lactoylglutathione lyase